MLVGRAISPSYSEMEMGTFQSLVIAEVAVVDMDDGVASSPMGMAVVVDLEKGRLTQLVEQLARDCSLPD
ncbi:hypothetical protein D3C80_2174670 [compost metagenome]